MEQLPSRLVAETVAEVTALRKAAGRDTAQPYDVVVALPVSWFPLAGDYTRHARTARTALVGSAVGYGAATIDAVVDYLLTRPGADTLFTSCADGPGSPRGFYLRHGFADTGRVMWGENVLALDLRRIRT